VELRGEGSDAAGGSGAHREVAAAGRSGQRRRATRTVRKDRDTIRERGEETNASENRCSTRWQLHVNKLRDRGSLKYRFGHCPGSCGKLG
jgi:hypothetical protein